METYLRHRYKMAAMMKESTAKQISSLTSEKARKKLSEILGVKNLSEDENPRPYFRVEFLYNVLMHIVEKGFPWPHVCRSIESTDELLTKTAGKDIVEAVRHLKLQSKTLLPFLGERNYEILRDFLLITYFSHYNLYHYVFTTTREIYRPNLTLDVVPPGEVQSIIDSKTERLWKYNDDIENLQNLEKLEDKNWNNELEQLATMVKDNAEHEDSITGQVTQKTAPKDKFQDTIASLSESVCAKLIENISVDFKHTFNSLGLRLDKTALPRPSELGPPERYPLGNMVTVKPSSREKNSGQKNASRASSKSKK